MLTLLLVASMGGTAPTDAEREFRAAVEAVVIEITAANPERCGCVPDAESLTVRDVRFWYDSRSRVLASVPAIAADARITYSTALPVFRDKA